MDFLEIAKKRYAVRKYQAKKVEEDKVMKILEAGRVAPTAANLQPQRLIVVLEREGLEKLKKAVNIYDAPLAIIICSDHNRAWKRPFDGKNMVDIDASIVTDHMMLQATELGLGTVWICYFKPDVLRKEFNLPANLEPINILAIGYADEEGALAERHDTARKPLADLVSYEIYKEK
ncbi:MAG: nitroreductase family protein [Desulfitobacteriaceae bacterium]